MDKLTTEQKAQRYDEVLERVVNIRTGKCETTFIFTEGLFDYLFPELEECNEEEVREAMIDFFKHEREEGVVVTHYGVNIERMIAWLEKQGQTFTKKDVDDAWLKGMCDAKKELEKQSGQNPTWSEEDEKMVNNILTPLAGRFPWNIYQPMYDWLKALKGRVGCEANCTSTKEWSEKDEVGLADAMWAIEQAKTIAKNENDMGNLWYAERFLKSLRPQKQWKPSDEQIDALEHFVRSIGESGYASPYDNNTKLLYSLLEQLKKL